MLSLDQAKKENNLKDFIDLSHVEIEIDQDPLNIDCSEMTEEEKLEVENFLKKIKTEFI